MWIRVASVNLVLCNINLLKDEQYSVILFLIQFSRSTFFLNTDHNFQIY